MIQFAEGRLPPSPEPEPDPETIPDVRNLAELLEAQARRTPAAVAITFDGRDTTYAELDAAASQIARAIRARIGDEREPVVGLRIGRGVEMVACLIGIWKAGAAYLPLDPGLPDARLRQILDEAAPALVVTTAALAAPFAFRDAPVLQLEEIGAASSERTLPPRGPADAASLAYVLYTSGSTGRPKGVEVTHGSVLNLLAACRREPGMSGRDVSLALARISFDVSVLELFLPLSCGARIVLLAEAATRDPYQLIRAIDQHEATVVQAPPALWQSLVDAGWTGRRTLRAWTGAETLPRPLADRLLPRCRELWNCYGLTETTVISTVHRVEAGTGDVPIGRPIAGVSVHILDAALRPVADGAEGELCIGGPGVALGYRARPELTAGRFVAPVGAARLCRTGDLARRGEGGVLHYLGRIDRQVKLRGFRVEPEEVEDALGEHPAVAACAVRAWPDAIGQNALCAYVVRRTGAEAGEAALKDHLRTRLPDYMVPPRVVFLPELPLTSNAKIDRAALPPLSDMANSSPGDQAAFTPTQRRLAAIWRSLLGVAPGPQDDFFDLGGYSLLTVKLLLHIEEAFGRNLSLAELLSHPSLAGMAALVDKGAGDAIARRLLAIRPEGRGAPLYWLDAGPLLRPALQAVGGENPVFGLTLAPEDEGPLLETGFDIARLASVVVDLLGEVTGDRPFHLGGWCRWGIVAFEVARQLQERGRTAPRLVLLDADLPSPHLGPRQAAGRLRRWAVGLDAATMSPTKSFSETVGLLSSTYAASAHVGDIALIQPATRNHARRAADRWGAVVRGRVMVHHAPGDHGSMVSAHGGRSLGAAIRDGLTDLETAADSAEELD